MRTYPYITKRWQKFKIILTSINTSQAHISLQDICKITWLPPAQERSLLSSSKMQAWGFNPASAGYSLNTANKKKKKKNKTCKWSWSHLKMTLSRKLGYYFIGIFIVFKFKSLKTSLVVSFVFLFYLFRILEYLEISTSLIYFGSF